MLILIVIRFEKKFLYTVLVILITGIAFFIAWQKYMTVHEPVLDNHFYKYELDTIKNLRGSLRNSKADLPKLKTSFVKTICERIFPYWYGTKWDFNGTTEIPQEGSIACGYFVTTTLRDMGIPIKRTKMAQCASEEMIRSLVSKKNIHHLSNISLAEFERKLKKLGEGLYVIGLDTHTGFILMSSAGNYFIHSSGWFPFKVLREKVATSGILERSKYRVVGKISDDEGFLRSWVRG